MPAGPLLPTRPRGAVLRLWDASYLLLTLATLLWSGNWIVGRAVHDAVPPVALSFWRWLGALVLVMGFAWPHLRRDWPAVLRHWPIMLVLSALGIAGFSTLGYVGLQSTTAINGLLLQSTMPVLILLGSFLIFGDRAGPAQLLGVAVSLAGVAVIVTHGNPLALVDLKLNAGDLWVLVAVVIYALYSTLLRKRPAVHPMSFLAASFALGTLMLLPFYLAEHASGRTVTLDSGTILAIGYVAVLPSFVAYLCYNRGVELIGPNRAGQFIHLMPAFGSAMAVIFLGEAFQLFHLVGIALIGAGIVLASRTRRA